MRNRNISLPFKALDSFSADPKKGGGVTRIRILHAFSGVYPPIGAICRLEVLLAFLCAIAPIFPGTANAADPQKKQGHPPDAPIPPQEFVANIGSGAWIITRGPLSARKARTLFNTKIPKILAANGCRGGRLHIGISDQIDKDGMTIPPETLKYINDAVDSCLDAGMHIVMMVEIIKGREPSEKEMELQYKIWDRVCYEMRNKSHRLAMAPFIEWHGWEKEPQPEKLKKFKELQRRCTQIFRKYNPTRIIAYKGMASSRLNGPPWGFLELDKKKPANPYFILCASAASLGTAHHSRKWADWGINKQYSQEEIKNEIFGFFKPALDFREKYGVAIFVDHWNAPLVDPPKLTVEEYIANLKKSKTEHAKKALSKILRDKAKAEKKGKTFEIIRYSLEQSKAFVSYVSGLIRGNRLGGAFHPHTVEYFWNRTTLSELKPTPGSPDAKAQDIIKKSWGKCDRPWKKGDPYFH